MKSTMKDFVVEPEHTALAIGSGGLEVLSTPSLIAYMENVCFEWLQTQLLPGYSSVGIQMDMKHLQPTGVSEKVTISIEVVEKNEQKVIFNCLATQGDKTIGTAVHKRFIVETKQFLNKINTL
ncbi:thioesterase family protein [Vagococcus zengguangii]|uniref:Fluoroacetyl-CoA-specific thioesterase-like domain-containing protein n=1 Tax=Vagococcus zengguangii TaxID=2571750 RepID=A0A4D7CU15_9ENTE|nr:thioesterase family protein [Vagococcus zengguangii]QCI86472.1 hypothetical protein FA707_05595 [Vagococcus zengguangii]TLG81278.1 hypothetical protein FE258_02020 [Vagococcus zengguangii]